MVPSQIWLNGSFVSPGDYFQKLKSGQQKTDRINAIVQPIFTEVKTGTFKKYGFILGCSEKPTNENCGKIIGKVVCSIDKSHSHYFKHERCNDPLCRICYPKYASRIAKAVVERVRGYRSVYGYDPLSHLIFWPDSLSGYTNITDAFRNAGVMLKIMGAKMAVVWYHPYRIPDEIKEQLRKYKREHRIKQSIGFWKLAHDDVLGFGNLEQYVVSGPHFHAVVSGYLMNVKEYSELDIGGYKKVRRLDSESDLETIAHYISTHACREERKSSVRYYGAISYSKLSRDEGVSKPENVKCEHCNADMEEHYIREVDGELEDAGLKHKCVTIMKTVYKYWKRGNKSPRLRKTRQDMIWGG